MNIHIIINSNIDKKKFRDINLLISSVDIRENNKQIILFKFIYNQPRIFKIIS